LLIGLFIGWSVGSHCANKPIEAQKKAQTTSFSIFKTIKLGTYSNADELRGALRATGNHISDWANDLLGKIKVAKQITETNLVIATVAELGFPNGATYQQITDKIKELGYQLCPAEAGPQLRLALTNQPANETLIMAMEPIRDSLGVLSVFGVGQGGGVPWLFGCFNYPGGFWDSSNRFVFVRPR
jgi:hypothetical protein